MTTAHLGSWARLLALRHWVQLAWAGIKGKPCQLSLTSNLFQTLLRPLSRPLSTLFPNYPSFPPQIQISPLSLGKRGGGRVGAASAHFPFLHIGKTCLTKSIPPPYFHLAKIYQLSNNLLLTHQKFPGPALSIFPSEISLLCAAPLSKINTAEMSFLRELGINTVALLQTRYSRVNP